MMTSFDRVDSSRPGARLDVRAMVLRRKIGTPHAVMMDFFEVAEASAGLRARAVTS
jgi:hypothetical protein